jgi:hypothetical protein
MWIRVTQRDIDKGFIFSVTACPVARALKRTFRKEVVTDGICFYFCNFESNKKQPLPNKKQPLPVRATAWISKFDTRKPVKPFAFQIKRPI